MATRYYVPFPAWDGEPCQPLPRHVLRIGDAERDAAAADLGDHYVAGRLTLDELHDRLGEVFAARTHGQLWKVMADLPSSGDTSPEQDGRFAALSLLILAMLIWLFTAYLFAMHGAYAHVDPLGRY